MTTHRSFHLPQKEDGIQKHVSDNCYLNLKTTAPWFTGRVLCNEMLLSEMAFLKTQEDNSRNKGRAVVNPMQGKHQYHINPLLPNAGVHLTGSFRRKLLA